MSEGFVSAINKITDAFRETLDTLLHGSYEPTIGDKVRVKHSHTGTFEGHIAECRTDSTCTVARNTDGVLVHVRRDRVKEVKE